jgi:hypothetical protein
VPIAPTDLIAAIEAQIAAIDDEIRRLREERGRHMRALEAERGLTVHEQSAKVDPMLQTARVHHSRSRSNDALAIYANEAHHSIRSLATAVGCSAPLLTQARDGICSISRVIAVKVQEATRSKKYPKGFEAMAKNWPKLRAE